jgi:hypothetical protein
VLHVPPALDDERAKPALAELLGGESACDAGADDYGVVGLRALEKHS